MRFGSRLANDTAVLTLLAVFVIVVLGVSDRVGDRASHHTVAISVVGALVLLAIYASWLPGYLRSDQAAQTAREDATGGHLPFVHGRHGPLSTCQRSENVAVSRWSVLLVPSWTPMTK